MPANLTPGYKAAEARYRSAGSVDEKLDALEEMLRTIPKHKGTEKMRSDIKQRISKTKNQMEQSKASGKKGITYHIPKEGAAQAVLIGPANAGKSSLLASFTNANANVAEYPYTTIKPQPGMLLYENLNFQLIDLPPVSEDFMEPWVPGLARVSDIILLVVGLDNIDELETVIQRMNESKIELVPTVAGADYNARIVKIPAVIIANKKDVSDASDNLALLREFYCELKILPVSSSDPLDSLTIGRHIFETLDLIRVYTRAPGKKENLELPIVLRRGALVLDVLNQIHKDFAEDLKFARIWGSGKFDGQRVQKDYEVHEGDILEFKI